MGDTFRDDLANVVGLKEGDIEQLPESVRRLSGKIRVMPKSEHHILFGLALDAPGVLTFAANIIPDRVVRILDCWQSGKLEDARALYLECLPLFDAIHIEPVPNAVFYMLERMGWDFGTPRIPGHRLLESNRAAVDAVLRELGLIVV